MSVWLWIHLLFLLASITVNCSVRTHYQRKPGLDDGYLTALTVSGSAQKQDTLKTHQTSMDRNPVVLDLCTDMDVEWVHIIPSSAHHGAHRQSEVQHGDIRWPLCFSINSSSRSCLHALTMKPGGTSARVCSTCRSMAVSGVASLFPLFCISLTPKQLINNPLCYLTDHINIPQV